MTEETMTRADRESLMKIVRQRERVAKTEAKERSARLLADFEQQLDRRYHYDENDVWAAATDIATRTVKEANEAIAQECERLGIPAQFAPKLSLGWNEQGRNAMKQQRSEMRRVAMREVEAAEKAARTTIERQSVNVQEQLMVGALTSGAARQFLESMPTVEALMPGLSVDRVQALIEAPK